MGNTVERFLETVKASVGDVEAELWEVFVSEGMMDAIHGGGQWLVESYVPSAGLAINVAYGHVNCFRTDASRYSHHENAMIKGKDPRPKGKTKVPARIVLECLVMIGASEELDREKDAVRGVLGVKKQDWED